VEMEESLFYLAMMEIHEMGMAVPALVKFKATLIA